MGVWCGFVLSWCFAWLVWLLYACGVRRFKGLRRVCLSFYLFAPAFISFPTFFACPLLVLFICPLALSLWVFGCVVVSFSLTVYTQKERARRVGASSLRGLWVVLDVLKHYRYFLRFIVPVSNPFAGDSGDLFRLIRWVVYYLPVFVNS